MRSTLIQPEFSELIEAADETCRRRFETRLAGEYLAGSVGAGEAWPGASDLDWWVFLPEGPTPADKAWRRRAEARLEKKYPVASAVHLSLASLERLHSEALWRFILRYNAARIRGENLIAQAERQGISTPRPSRKLAKSRLPFVRRCLDEAVAGRCPPSLGRLPSDRFLASRKLTRNFVIVEGAFVLMCQRRFTSFKQEAVIDGLRSSSPRWSRLLNVTAAILKDPFQAKIRPKDVVHEIEPYMEWAIDLIQNS